MKHFKSFQVFKFDHTFDPFFGKSEKISFLSDISQSHITKWYLVKQFCLKQNKTKNSFFKYRKQFLPNASSLSCIYVIYCHI